MGHQSDSSSYSSEECTTGTSTNYTGTNTHCDTDTRSRNCDSRSCDSRSYDSRDCGRDCGLKESKTPVGVWNLVYTCDNACTTTGSMEWLNQLLLNGDKTLNNFIPPDVCNNPFNGVLPTTGSGVWEMVGPRKFKLEIVHIAYRVSDGCAQAYVKVKLVMKLSRRGTRARFCGNARIFDLCDPKMCYPADADPIYFTGHGAKVLEPRD